MTDFSQKINLNWSGDGGPAIQGPVTVTCDSAWSTRMTLANDSSQPVAVFLRNSGLKLLYLKSDIAATLSFKDSGGTEVGNIVLVAGQPYAWWNTSGQTIPISADVAEIIVSSAADGTLEIRVGQDGTPSAATAALGGNITSAVESEIVSGGKVITLTLTGATWAPAGAAFNAQRQAILDGIDSAQAEAAGWDAQKVNLPVTNVVRTSSTIVTITLSSLGSYSVTASETLTATIPAPATTAGEPIVASPTATITANS